MDEELVTVPELLKLLQVALQCAEQASAYLRFDFYDTQQRVCVGLFQAVLEYARAVLVLVRDGMLYAPAFITRSALDAYVDIVNACADGDYCGPS